MRRLAAHHPWARDVIVGYPQFLGMNLDTVQPKQVGIRQIVMNNFV